MQEKNCCFSCLGIAFHSAVEFIGVEELVTLLLVVLVRHTAPHLVPVHLQAPHGQQRQIQKTSWIAYHVQRSTNKLSTIMAILFCLRH